VISKVKKDLIYFFKFACFFPRILRDSLIRKKEKKTGNLEANKWQCPILIPVVLCCSNFVPRDSAQLENRAPNMMWNLLLLSGVVISPKSREWRKYKNEKIKIKKRRRSFISLSVPEHPLLLDMEESYLTA
jgi:hypothetical protein